MDLALADQVNLRLRVLRLFVRILRNPLLLLLFPLRLLPTRSPNLSPRTRPRRPLHQRSKSKLELQPIHRSTTPLSDLLLSLLRLQRDPNLRNLKLLSHLRVDHLTLPFYPLTTSLPLILPICLSNFPLSDLQAQLLRLLVQMRWISTSKRKSSSHDVFFAVDGFREKSSKVQ